MLLEKILRAKAKEVEEKKKKNPLPELEKEIARLDFLSRRSFREALSGKSLSLIAEVKKASPTKGVLTGDFDPVHFAKAYEEAGASALSVLTEKNYFGGSLKHFIQVRKVTSLPLLRKDFIIDEYQIYETKAKGADAILLIASILERGKLKKFFNLAKELGLDVLIETHNREEVEEALELGAEIIGINNRDLKTFKTYLNVTLQLSSFIPEDKILVSESGIKTYRDVDILRRAGVDAVLVGEVLIKSKNIKDKIKELLGNELVMK